MKKTKENKLIRIDISLISIGILLLVAIHFLRTDGSFIGNSLSNYAASEYGYIVNIAFYMFALVNIIIGVLFSHYKNLKIRISSFLFFICSVFIVLLTVFHSDGNGLIETPNEFVHIISAISLFLMYPIIILLSGLQFKTKLLRRYSAISFILIAGLTVFGIIFTLKNLTTGLLETSLFGILEKAGVLIIVLWLVVLLVSHNKIKTIVSKKVS